MPEKYAFYKKAYKTNIVTEETYRKWIEVNPQFKHIDYQKFKRYYRLFREEVLSTMVNNPLGFDSGKLGTFGVTVIDIDFKCAEDFNKRRMKYKNTDELPTSYITIETPKKMKITWKKHKITHAIVSLFGMQPSSHMRQIVGPAIGKKTNFYPKARKASTVESKCEAPKKEKSLFDIA